MMHLAVATLLALAQTNDKAQANGYDDAWKSAWKTHLTTVISGGPTKVNGFVLQVGDSITHANPYGQWARGSTGKTAEDNAVCVWAQTTTGFPGNFTDATQTNGFYLALADTKNNRGMTASGGIAAFEYVSGSGNDTDASTMPVTDGPMPSTNDPATGRSYVASTNYDSNLQINTVAAAFNTAQFAVVMLGTNDIGNGRSNTQYNTDLGTIVTTLESQHIGVILSTIPPRVGFDVTAYNAAIRAMAQARSLPLIDFYAEILARRPGTTWQGTLIDSADGEHPTAVGANGDPYSPGGNAAVNQTGTNCLNCGYLLRGWLTMQKLKEVKSFVVDGAAAVPANPAPAPGPGPGPATPPAPSAPKNNSGGGGGCGGSVGGPVSPGMLLGSALAALVLLRATRKTGF
jgi:hypothetical protein